MSLSHSFSEGNTKEIRKNMVFKKYSLCQFPNIANKGKTNINGKLKEEEKIWKKPKQKKEEKKEKKSLLVE